MAKYTLYLLIISVVLSLFSLVAIKFGGSEIYPFYSWKLFTKPSGGTSQETEYRLYGVNNTDTVRIGNTYNEFYDENVKFRLINDYANSIVKKKEVAKNRDLLLKFAKTIEPNYQYYLLVQEFYNPKDLDKKNLKIYRKIITTLK